MAHASVKLNASAGGYKAEMKSAMATMKELSSEYTLAAAQAKLFGKATDELKAKSEMLTKKVEVQKGIVKTNGDEQERLTQKLEKQKARQEELTGKIKDAQKAYEAEKEATGKNSEESKKLKAALEKLDSEYKKNEADIRKSEVALTNQNAKTNEAKAKLAELEKELKDVNKELKAHGWNEFAKGCETVGGKIQDIGKKMTVLSTGILTAGGTSAKFAMDFEDSFAKVTTIMDEGVVSTDEMQRAIVDLSSETGIAATDIAENVYNAISAGQDTGDAVNFVRESTKLATAGFAESGQTLDVLTTILNAYGLEAEQVTNVSDMLIQTQNLGKTTVAELSSSMGKVIPTANANGVALDQLCASYAIMTANGVATAESTTYINSMLNELGKTGSATDVILREKTGKSFGELMKSGASLSDVLGVVEGAAREQNLSLSDMFSSAEAAKAGLILLGDDAGVFNGTLQEMRQSTGMTDEAFEKMQTSSYDVKKSLNELKNTAMDLGSTIMEEAAPIIETVSDKISQFREWFTGLDDDQKKMIVTIGAVVAAIGPVLVVGGTLIKGVKTVIDVGKSVSGVIGGVGKVLSLCSPQVLIVVGVVAALVAAGVALYQNWDKIKEWAGKLWEGIKKTFDDNKNAISNAFTEAWKAVTNKVKEIQDGISNGFNAAKEAVANKVKEIQDGVSNGFNAAKEAAKNKLDEMKNAVLENPIVQVTGQVFGAVGDVVDNVMKAADDTVKEKLDNMKTAYEENGGGIQGIVAAGWEGIKGFHTAGFTFVDNLTGGKLTELQTKFSEKTNAVKEDWKSKFANIRDTATNLMQNAKDNVATKLENMKAAYNEKGGGIKGIVNATFTGVRDIMSSAMNVANSLTGGRLDAIRLAFSSKLEAARSAVSSVMDRIKSAFTDKMDGAKSAVSGAIDKIKGFFNFSWSLPKLKMPHPKISGKFSLNPPQVPSFSIDWYKIGGIMNSPTIFGMSGSTLLAGGEPETGGEAILPLAPFYTRLNAILDKKLEVVERMHNVYVENHTYIDGEEISSRTVTKVDEKRERDYRKRR